MQNALAIPAKRKNPGEAGECGSVQTGLCAQWEALSPVMKSMAATMSS